MDRLRKAMHGGWALALAVFALTAFAETGAPPKVLHMAQQSIGGGPLDPAQINSIYDANLIENIVEPMLRYDYLARPLKLVPNTLAAMPEVSDAGRVYICRLRHGILFSPHPAFRGKPRELIAADYAYSIRRLFDPKFRSSQFFVVDGKIAGANALREAAQKSGRFDLDTPIAGITVLDRYTLRIALTQPDLNFTHVLAQQNLAAVAREVVEYYGNEIVAHPVGTGPFQMESLRRGSKMVLVANPNYRDDFFPAVGEDTEPAIRRIAAGLAGRKLPMVDRVELTYTAEDQPMWLSFVKAELDYLINVPVAFRASGVPGGKLAPNLERRGVQLFSYVYPSVWFTNFNMRDAVVGGYAAERVALRRAIALAFDNRAAIAIAMNGSARPVIGLVPPGVPGYDTQLRTDVFVQDLAKARALLDLYGYIDRDGDGWRETPEGRPLSVEMLGIPEPRFRPWDELWAKAFAALGIRLDVRHVHQADLLRMIQAGQFQMAFGAWNMDYPDGEDFYITLYGPSTGFANTPGFALPAYDRLYEQSQKLPDSPQRDALYRQMDKLSFAYMPMVMHLYLTRSAVSHPWLHGYIPHPVHVEPWKYLDIDAAARDAYLRQ
ncbi:MAG: hypothetical protein HY255_11795 [Betaproteobacteria bacterium]|nr:hypothetical protein [Betaproteobacteria bacterium]